MKNNEIPAIEVFDDYLKSKNETGCYTLIHPKKSVRIAYTIKMLLKHHDFIMEKNTFATYAFMILGNEDIRTVFDLCVKSLGDRFMHRNDVSETMEYGTLYIEFKSNNSNSSEPEGRLRFNIIEVEDEERTTPPTLSRGGLDYGSLAGLIIYNALDYDRYELSYIGGLFANLREVDKSFKIQLISHIPGDHYRKTKEHVDVLEQRGYPESKEERKMLYAHSPYRLYELGLRDDEDKYYTYMIFDKKLIIGNS